jgi:hypothetical protein
MKVDLQQRVVLWAQENGVMALLALLLAVFVYLTILELVSNTTTRTVAVEVERESGVALMAVRPATVQVTFRGALNEFQQLDRADLRMTVKGLRIRSDEGIVRVPLKRGNLRGAAGLRVVNIEPPVVEITFDHQGEREFAIAPPPIEGKPFRGHAEVDYTPKTAVVRGARLQLDRLHDAGVTLQMEPVNVDGRVQGFTRRAPILPPADAWQPEIAPESVTVKVNIVPDNIQREFADIPVRLALLPGPTNLLRRVQPAAVTVRLTGWAEALQDIATNAIRVYAELPAADASVPTNPIPLRVLLPPGTTVEEVITLPDAVRLAAPAETR